LLFGIFERNFVIISKNIIYKIEYLFVIRNQNGKEFEIIE